MIKKGGIIGLPQNDFYRRQKSGDWTIDEHFRNVNYIRTNEFTPDNYLAIGEYQSENITVYDIFNEEISSLTKPTSDQVSISCIDYNRNINQLAVGLNKSPFLRIFDTSVPNTEEIEETQLNYTGSLFTKSIEKSDFIGSTLVITHGLNDSYPAITLFTTTYEISYSYVTQIINANKIRLIFETEPNDISGILYVYSHTNSSKYLLKNLTRKDNYLYQTYKLNAQLNNPILQEENLNATETLFIDDTLINIDKIFKNLRIT